MVIPRVDVPDPTHPANPGIEELRLPHGEVLPEGMEALVAMVPLMVAPGGWMVHGNWMFQKSSGRVCYQRAVEELKSTVRSFLAESLAELCLIRCLQILFIIFPIRWLLNSGLYQFFRCTRMFVWRNFLWLFSNPWPRVITLLLRSTSMHFGVQHWGIFKIAGIELWFKLNETGHWMEGWWFRFWGFCHILPISPATLGSNVESQPAKRLLVTTAVWAKASVKGMY